MYTFFGPRRHKNHNTMCLTLLYKEKDLCEFNNLKLSDKMIISREGYEMNPPDEL